MRRLIFATIVAVFVSVMIGCKPSAPRQTGLAGPWVMRLGQRPFMVLHLSEQSGKWSGTLAGVYFTTSDALSFSGIHGPTMVRQLSGFSSNGGALTFTATNPSDPIDTDDYQFILSDAEHARLE